VLLVAAMAIMFVRLPASFLPEEDQGVLLTMVQLPAGSTQEQTQDVLTQVNDYFNTKEKDVVKSVFTVSGFGF
ncbi:efflux RND transporter permease subunit, partial [Proteus mirabilis]